MTDTEKEVSKIVKNAVVPSTEPSSKQVTPAQTDNKVISTEMSDVGKNETKHSIMRNSKGLYVQADRQVIKGDDPSQWSDQVTNYINTKIRNGNDVVVIAADGDPLTITADTEGKAHFRNYIDMGNGQKRLMTDEEYAVKLRAETHIDELAAVSKRGPKIVPDYKNHPFAVDGFNYRTAYFMDNDGQYYRLTISVGKNGLINTVYNVGKTKEAKYSLMAQRPDSNTVGSSASNNKVPQNNGFVNNQFMQNNENVASDNGNVEKSTKPLTIEQKIRAFLNSENQRVSTATGKTLTQDAFAVVEPTTRKQKNLVKDCASLGIEVRYIKTQNNDIIGTSHNINGAYRDGVIYINEDAQNPYRVVLGHEVTHQIKVTDINAYNALEDIARKHIGESFDNLTLDKQEEAVADFVGAVMDNPRAYKSVFQQNRNLLQRFIEAVDSIIGKFRGTETYNDDLSRMLNDTKAELTGEDAGETKYSLSKNARADVHKALENKFYQREVKLTDTTPSIMLSHKDVKNLPMLMKPSHIRENVFTEEEARKKRLPINKGINYHGLGEPLFLKVIEELDNVTEAYRGTKNAADPTRREKYFLLISTQTDKEGNIINIPVYINEKGQYNRVFIDTNKIATVFGKSGLREYINEQLQRKNLVRIKNKNRSNQISEPTSPIDARYEMDASKVGNSETSEVLPTNNMVSQDKPIVNNNYMQDGEKDTQGTTSYSRMNENNVLSAADERKLERQENIIDSNSKVNNYLRRARTMFVNDVEELMNIPKVLKNNDLKQVFNQLWNEYKESGKIAPESFNKVFDMLYENGKAISTEFYEQ